MEAVTYEKLRSYSDAVPEAVLRTWQPPQAVKALLEYEPDADKGFVMAVGIETEKGKPSSSMHYLGEHKPLKLTWLRKNYNKVGGLLHFPAQAGTGGTTPKPDIDYLVAVLAELEEVLAETIGAGVARAVYVFPCISCQRTVLCNRQRVLEKRAAACFVCGATYEVDVTDHDTPKFYLRTTELVCSKCQRSISVEERKLDIGFKFAFSGCGTKHEIVTNQWLCRIVENASRS